MTQFYNYLQRENKIDLSMFTENDISDIIKISELYSFMETDILNEGIKDWGKNISNMLKKLGLHVENKKGLISYFSTAGKNVSQLFWYALKSMTGDKDAREKMKEIANKEVKKEDVIDFLLKLDTLSLHLLTQPIHIIDSLTGWHIWANVSTKSKDLVDRAQRAIDHLTKISMETTGKVKKNILSMINKLKELLGLNGKITV